MRLIEGNKEIDVSENNWPLTLDLFIKWGYPEGLLKKAKGNENYKLKAQDLDRITPELSAWGIHWKRIKWNYD